VFDALGASAEVRPHAVEYFTIRVAWAPVACLLWTTEGWFHGRGDTRTPMVASLLGNGVNLVLDPLLIFGWGPFPALGVEGAAWATVIAMGSGVLVLAWGARSALPWARWGLDLGLVRKVFNLGLPLAAQWTLDFGGFLVFLGLLARAGDAHLAAHFLVFRIVQVSMLPGFALGDAAGVLVGQAVGARRPSAAREAWWAGTTLAIGTMAGFGVVFLAVPGWLLFPFGAEPEVVALALPLLALAAAWQVFDAVVMVNFNTLTAAGDTRFTLVLFVGGSWLVQVPLALWMVGVLEWGAIGAWLGLTSEIVLVSLISLARVLGHGWLERRIHCDAERVAPATTSAAVAK
jgi:MATE family multidrug resistance protein